MASKFDKLASKLEKKAASSGYPLKDPKALAADIGRKKYGAEQFQKMAEAGKKKKK